MDISLWELKIWCFKDLIFSDMSSSCLMFYISNCLISYLCLFSDGGGDHNVTFLFVQCVLLALFHIGDFDVMNVGRCASNQSYINPAERCMSLLNIGMQGLALERDDTGPFEQLIKNCKSMKDIRLKAKSHQGLKEAYQSSLEPAIKLLEISFKCLELKGKSVQVSAQSQEY